MKYAEIEAFLRERQMMDVLKGLLDAVEKEEAFLAEHKQRRYDPAMKEEAQALYAEDITRAMVDGSYLNPRSVLSHRDRYMTAWAIAQLIATKQLEEAVEDLFDEAQDLRRVDLAIIAEKDDQLEEARSDRTILVKNLCWMAERVHQGHHPQTKTTWRECDLGVCGSMEHMLAQVGLDKDLNKIKRRP
jgi:hypothetical protein